MAVGSLFQLYSVPKNFLSMKIALRLLIGEFIVGILGFIVIGGYSFFDALYMVVLTISTVGFNEVSPLDEAGRIFTSVLIMSNIGIFAYSLAVFSYFIIEGEIFKNMYAKRIKKRVDDLEGHIILCGYGKYGKEITNNLMLHQTPFVVLENSPEKIDLIQQSEQDLLFIEGDATKDELLYEAGIERARGLITALGDDSDNLFIVFSARQLNPRLTIISRAIQERSQAKMIKAGANHVVMPENIGAFYMATLVNKPGAVEFFSFITNEYHSDIGFEELGYENLPMEYRGKPISSLNLRQQTGVNIIGYRDKFGKYIVNPGPETILEHGAKFIVLGSEDQLTKLLQICKMDKV